MLILCLIEAQSILFHFVKNFIANSALCWLRFLIGIVLKQAVSGLGVLAWCRRLNTDDILHAAEKCIILVLSSLSGDVCWLVLQLLLQIVIHVLQELLVGKNIRVLRFHRSSAFDLHIVVFNSILECLLVLVAIDTYLAFCKISVKIGINVHLSTVTTGVKALYACVSKQVFTLLHIMDVVNVCDVCNICNVLVLCIVDDSRFARRWGDFSWLFQR